MAQNDPVLQRAMFQKQGQSVAPAVGLGGGLGSMPNPDQNAQALRSMFQPTVAIGGPSQMLEQAQPVQSFQEGGLAQFLPSFMRLSPPSETESARLAQRDATRRFNIDDAEMIAGRGPSAAVPGPMTTTIPGSTAARAAERRGQPPAGPSPNVLAQDEVLATPEAQSAMRMMEEGRVLRNPDMYRQGEATLRRLTEEAYSRRGIESLPEVPSRPTLPSTPAPDVPLPPRRSDQAPEEPPAAPSASAPAAGEKKPDMSISTVLSDIKAERAADRRENALLALMQAGFAMAGGRSPNAISNIGAGGQAGIAAFAAMEKARREEQAALRRDELSIRLAQAKMAEDPEAVKTFKTLGGGDIMKGFEIFNSDKKLQAATAIAKDITAPEEDRRAAAEYIRGQLTKARTGGGSFSGFSATPVR
jgi:hypothetical protein